MDEEREEWKKRKRLKEKEACKTGSGKEWNESQGTKRQEKDEDQEARARRGRSGREAIFCKGK